MANEPREQELKQRITEQAEDGKISCNICQEIAREYDAKLDKIGKLADESGIKIISCQLGCF